MDCPRCSRELAPIKVGGVTVDACQGGCGGIWFDLFELQKMDAPDESAGSLLDGMRVDVGTEVDFDQTIDCPRCDGLVLMRQQHPTKPEIMTDKCPACGGVWLDFGELFQLRSESASDRPDVSGVLGGLKGSA